MNLQQKRQKMRDELRQALNQLESNPEAWHGVRAGWKAQATRAYNWLQANPPAPLAALREYAKGRESITERGEA